jgi:hypothetical protein
MGFRPIVLALTLSGLMSATAWAAPAVSSIWSGKSSGATVTWSEQDLKVQLAEASARSLFPPLQAHLGAPLEERNLCYQERSIKVLSVVGPYLSTEDGGYWNCLGTAHPGSVTRFTSHHLWRLGQPLRLSDVFPEAQVLKALLAEPLIRKTLTKAKISPLPSTLPALVKQLTELNDECEYYFDDDLLERFAFHHVEKGQVAVRIGLSHGCEAARGRLTQLGILLPIPPALQQPLMAAQTRRQGFLMKDAEAVSKGRYTLQTLKDPGYKEP